MPHSYAEALLISEKERETQNHYHYSLSLFYISTCFQACLWMMESLKNFQILRKKKGDYDEDDDCDSTSRNWYDA